MPLSDRAVLCSAALMELAEHSASTPALRTLSCCLQMDETADASSAHREETLPIHASTSGISPFQPVHTSSGSSVSGSHQGHKHKHSFSGGRSAPGSPYTLQRTMTADLARQQIPGPARQQESSPGAHLLRRADSTASDAGLGLPRMPVKPLRRTASVGDFPASASEFDLEAGQASCRESYRGGVLDKIIGRVGGSAGRSAGRKAQKFLTRPFRVSST